jgi:nucleoside 2-deoxyribosyltransferase
MRRPIVYLAGGFRSNWQMTAKSAIPEFEWLDPSAHKLQDPMAYTQWDLDAIRRSDTVLAYLEDTNPGGYALALELGYAKALGKTILLVEFHSDDTRRKYFEMVRQVADRRFETLSAALEHLKMQTRPRGVEHP